jgi:hypothetical protein
MLAKRTHHRVKEAEQPNHVKLRINASAVPAQRHSPLCEPNSETGGMCIPNFKCIVSKVVFQDEKMKGSIVAQCEHMLTQFFESN